MDIPLQSCVSVATNGAPSMVGKQQGLVARLKKDVDSLMAFHCIMHQTVLCGKLDGAFQDLMTKSMKMINFLKAQSALRHRNLRAFLEEQDADYQDLLTHNNIRWLSKGNALSRIWSLRKELLSFLTSCTNNAAQTYIAMLSSTADMANLAFLVDICGHLNELNLQLQGKDKTVIELLSSVESFQLKLELFKNDLRSNQFQFETLKSYLAENEDACISDTYIQFIEKLEKEFTQRFSQFKEIRHTVKLIKSPKTCNTSGEWIGEVSSAFQNHQISVANLQRELCQLKAEDPEIAAQFWTLATTRVEYPNLSKLARTLLTIFAATYICESAFSNLNHVKSKLRTRLTHEHLEQLLRVALTESETNYEEIVRTYKQTHTSH